MPGLLVQLAGSAVVVPPASALAGPPRRSARSQSTRCAGSGRPRWRTGPRCHAWHRCIRRPRRTTRRACWVSGGPRIANAHRPGARRPHRRCSATGCCEPPRPAPPTAARPDRGCPGGCCGPDSCSRSHRPHSGHRHDRTADPPGNRWPRAVRPVPRSGAGRPRQRRRSCLHQPAGRPRQPHGQAGSAR